MAEEAAKAGEAVTRLGPPSRPRDSTTVISAGRVLLIIAQSSVPITPRQIWERFERSRPSLRTVQRIIRALYNAGLIASIGAYGDLGTTRGWVLSSLWPPSRFG